MVTDIVGLRIILLVIGWLTHIVSLFNMFRLIKTKFVLN